jgi:hypothetical protein
VRRDDLEAAVAIEEAVEDRPGDRERRVEQEADGRDQVVALRGSE